MNLTGLSRALGAVVATLVGVAVCLTPVASAGDPDVPAVAPAPRPAHYVKPHDPWAVRPVLPRYHRTATVLQAPAPTRVTIDAIGVGSPLVPLGLGAGGVMQVPTDYDTAGWYTPGARPGENGPAVIAGHVDSGTGPAVFFHLRDLRPGNRVVVDRADGSRVTFMVDSVRQYAKATFATETVFGPTTVPALRLITCGGEFDHASGHYRDNVVVFASLRR
jgi:hypothetical protein